MAKKKTSSRNASNALSMAALATKIERETPSIAIIVGKEDLLRREARDMILSALAGGRPDSDQIQSISPQIKPDEERLQNIKYFCEYIF